MLLDVIYTASWSANKWKAWLAQCRTGQNGSSLTGFDLLLLTGEMSNLASNSQKTPYVTILSPGARPELKSPNWSAPMQFNGTHYDKKPFLKPLEQLNTHCVTSMQYGYCWDRKVEPFSSYPDYLHPDFSLIGGFILPYSSNLTLAFCSPFSSSTPGFFYCESLCFMALQIWQQSWMMDEI